MGALSAAEIESELASLEVVLALESCEEPGVVDFWDEVGVSGLVF